MKLFLYLLVMLFISSCAFNKMFLNPRPLHATDHFSEYDTIIGDTLTLTFLDDFSPEIKNSKGELADLGYQIEDIRFPNSIGDTLYGWFVKPQENYNGITIYYLHGNSGNLVYNYRLMEPFIKKGFQVFMIDYNGFGFSQGDAKRKIVLSDAKDGLDYLFSSKVISYDKLIMYGQSLGGHLAAVSGSQNQDKIDALVIEGAFSSHKDVASDRVPLLSRIFVKEIYSAEKSIPNHNKPLLIIHSTEDGIIPFKHAERLYELANEPKELFTIDGRHVFGPLLYGESIAEKMIEMVK